MKYVFVVERHEEYGELGFKPKWMPVADPLGGMAVAHDILEHIKNDDGSTEHELLALGSSMWIRGDGCYYDAKGLACNDEAKYIGYAFPELFRIHEQEHGGGHIRFFRNVYGDLRERCERVVHEGNKRLREDEMEPLGTQDQRMARNWLAEGYRRARRRFYEQRGLDACTVAHYFLQIEKEADGLLGQAEEGMELTVHIKFNEMQSMRMSIGYPADPYDY